MFENEKFILTRLRAENGVAEKTDWFGYSDFYPRPVPTPISAIPIVPAVVHDEPVAKATIQESRHPANKKIPGLRIAKP